MADKMKAAAAALKAQGTTAFSQQNYASALELYTQAADLDPTDPVYFSNMALCEIKLEKWEDAEKHADFGLLAACGSTYADKAVASRHKLGAKLLWRRGVARRKLGSLSEARTDLESALKLEPNNKSVSEELNALAWDEKRGKRKTNSTASVKTTTPATQPKNGSRSSYPGQSSRIEEITEEAVVEKKDGLREIAVKKVDTLPKEFAEILLKSKELKTTAPTPAIASSAKATNANVTNANVSTVKEKEAEVSKNTPSTTERTLPFECTIQQVVISKAYPATLSLYELTHLLRRPASERAQVLAYLFYRIPPASLKAIFGRGGIEGHFIEAFLSAIEYASISALGARAEQEEKKSVVLKSVEILRGMIACGRFSIAKVFINGRLTKSAFEVLKGLAREGGLEKEAEQTVGVWEKT
ncbi:hypothetical protein BZA70DRAFT_176386 [Myxozyma melibiosi]|uniref:RNA polymerase II-associated protein 3 n=1 Tax=Myxozyma melibiosi TaxID=54550 RepID=A0ABR1F5V3_9ASCO